MLGSLGPACLLSKYMGHYWSGGCTLDSILWTKYCKVLGCLAMTLGHLAWQTWWELLCVPTELREVHQLEQNLKRGAESAALGQHGLLHSSHWDNLSVPGLTYTCLVATDQGFEPRIAQPEPHKDQAKGNRFVCQAGHSREYFTFLQFSS